MPQLDVNDIQGNVVAGYGTTYARYVFWRFGQIDDRLRRLLGSFAPTPAKRRVHSGDREVTRNIAFTATGMLKLGLPQAAIQDLPLAFRAGMRARARAIGDIDASSPSSWEPWCNGSIDALVTITGWTPGTCDAAVSGLPRWLERLHVQPAAALNEDRKEFESPPPEDPKDRCGWRYEPFGFRDGLSNPVIEGSPRALKAGDGTLREGRWQTMKAGEFILGHEDDTRSIDLPRAMRRFFRNGSYVVWRKLAQNVTAFDERFERGSVEAARLVGRWPDGTPLAVSPNGHPAAPGLNDFTFAADPLGRLCPVSAHIRRANPRDALDFADDVVGRHRIIRRGMPYTDADGGQGLIFVCFNADIERQFEFVQRRWIIDDPSRAIASAPDPIAAPARDDSLASYVTTRAGEYFFQPGLLGLDELLRASERMPS